MDRLIRTKHTTLKRGTTTDIRNKPLQNHFQLLLSVQGDFIVVTCNMIAPKILKNILKLPRHPKIMYSQNGNF